MEKQTLFNFIVNYINFKKSQGSSFVDKKWVLNDYYKSIETPTSKFVKQKEQCKYVFTLLVKSGYIKSWGNGLYKILLEIPNVSSYELRKYFQKI